MLQPDEIFQQHHIYRRSEKLKRPLRCREIQVIQGAFSQYNDKVIELIRNSEIDIEDRSSSSRAKVILLPISIPKLNFIRSYFYVEKHEYFKLKYHCNI